MFNRTARKSREAIKDGINNHKSTQSLDYEHWDLIVWFHFSLLGDSFSINAMLSPSS